MHSLQAHSHMALTDYWGGVYIGRARNCTYKRCSRKMTYTMHTTLNFLFHEEVLTQIDIHNAYHVEFSVSWRGAEDNDLPLTLLLCTTYNTSSFPSEASRRLATWFDCQCPEPGEKLLFHSCLFYVAFHSSSFLKRGGSFYNWATSSHMCKWADSVV